MKPILPVILCGGSGTRLWPVSRDSMPKQFLPLFGERSTFQQTLERVADKNFFLDPIILTSEDLRFFVRQQAQDIGSNARIMLEPVRRDSAPAIVAATLFAAQRDPQQLVLILAADHLIPENDTALFKETCITGRDMALEGYLVTFGIPPTEPTNRFGYIERGTPLHEDVHKVAAFVEKPTAKVAEEYIKQGYLWNSGNLLFRADTMLAEVERLEPSMFTHVRDAVRTASSDLEFVRLESTSFKNAPQKSIDYAVMEKSDRVVVVATKFGWSDVGSWEGLYKIVDKDKQGNAIRGSVVLRDTENSLVHGEVGVTALLGVKDVVVITTADAVLVVARDRTEEVKQLVKDVQGAGYKQAAEHRRMYRPWGYYENIDLGNRFQVKRIVVNSGAKLSLQKHLHRAEHWVVVRGVAEVTVGTEKKIVHENESVYVPMEEVHRLANPGKIQLELIEVQTGSYLGEDDIERLEDVYKRGNS